VRNVSFAGRMSFLSHTQRGFIERDKRHITGSGFREDGGHDERRRNACRSGIRRQHYILRDDDDDDDNDYVKNGSARARTDRKRREEMHDKITRWQWVPLLFTVFDWRVRPAGRTRNFGNRDGRHAVASENS